MRILFTLQPALGHLHPLVGLARAAQAAGHTVEVACAAAFCPEVARAGFTARPAGLDWRESQAEQSFPTLSTLPPGPQANAWWVRQIFAGATARAMAADLCAGAGLAGYDLVVRDPLEFGGLIAAERAGLPHATAGASVFVPPRDWRALAGPQLAELRQAYGLPADPGLRSLYRFLDLSGVPPAFVAGAHIAPVTHFIQPAIYDGADDWPLPAWLGAADRRPLVLATLGTVFNRTPGIVELIVGALRDEPLRLALATGPHFPAERLAQLAATKSAGRSTKGGFVPHPASCAQTDQGARQPSAPPSDNVLLTEYLPLSQALPHCALLISHGGLNSVVAALCHGVPLVLIPLGADQPANARRCTDLGVAQVIGPGERSAAHLRAAVRTVLGQPAYRERARHIQRAIADLPSPAHAVGLLERLAAERRPLPARRSWWRWR